MQRADRDWILSQLPVDARERIGPLLHELNAMGADRLPASTFDELVDSAARAPQAAPNPEIEAHDVSSGIAHADHAGIQAALAGEPDWVVALVVSYAEWPWLEEFIEALPSQRVAELHVFARELGAVVKPRVKDAILRALAERLPGTETEGEHASRFDRLVNRIGRHDPPADSHSRNL
jgi:hypothetical protein